MINRSPVSASRIHLSFAGCLIILLSTISCQRSIQPEYHQAELSIEKQIDVDYRLYIPASYDSSTAWQLVLYLTGSDPSESMNSGMGKALEAGLESNFFLVVPQLTETGIWDVEALMHMLTDIESRYTIDTDNRRVIGFGDEGGYGAWDVATSYPDAFSKIVPISAPACTEICRLGGGSIRIFHGALDTLVPVADAVNMHFELDHYCGSDVEITIFDSLGHNIQDEVFLNEDFWMWFTGSAFAQVKQNHQIAEEHFSLQVSRSVSDNYLLYLPQGYSWKKQQWPLLIFLHGSGSAIQDIEKIRTTGPPSLFEQGMNSEFVLLAPQLHDNLPWDIERTYALIKKVISEYKVDASRIYVTGLSRGGFGTWELAVDHPKLFAAVVPISARDIPAVERLTSSNLWIFHGGDDDGVPWQGSQFMFNRLENTGANVNFSLYDGVGHNAWDRAYNDPALWQWLLAQTNENP